MTTLEVLVAARAKVAQGWTQRASARNADKAKVHPCDPAARCWCMLGAVAAITHNTPVVSMDIADTLRNALPEAPRWDNASYNDTLGRTQAEVLAVFDHAIAAQRECA